MSVLQEIYDSILNGQQKVTVEKVGQALAEGIGPEVVLNEGMVKAMAEVGKLFEEGEYFVPEMLIAARAMQGGLAVLKPRLVAADFKPIARVAAGTVKGDLHDIGKNLVCMMLEGASFEILDLGTDVRSEEKRSRAARRADSPIRRALSGPFQSSTIRPRSAAASSLATR